MKRKKRMLVCTTVLVLLIAGAIVAGCAQQPSTPTIEKPEPNEYGVIVAAQWKETYPDIYASYEMNRQNTSRVSYIEEDPFIVTLYDGMGFSKDYTSAIGHPYTLEDVAATARPHKLAQCITCKSPEMTAMVNAQGDSVYAMEFDEVYSKLTEPVSCYNCHENTGDELVITHKYLSKALGSDVSKVDPKTAACGQCHNEYYFDATSKATTLPWTGLSAMTPDAILAYYNNLNFVDFTNTISGTGMIKVQHPEFETVLGAGGKAQSMGGFSCADCHMGTVEKSAGSSYVSHNWQSPLKNQQLIENKCSSCHSNLATEVAAIQKKVTERETAIGLKLEDLTRKIGAGAADGSKSEEELTALRSLLRDAQFYWDFCYVENSEGAHNSTMANQLLDKAEQRVDQGLASFA
ncbi:MAG: ammonia-forming cytochrome c nitrite reductase subunit c552 [Coriobacteriales bacterium]|jgi:nitrite reductase (cytochrome c-552)|nr:ammonia-forming cytochrome c nitrite reductase subunit c552 [Coriobacteriales bacterium]